MGIYLHGQEFWIKKVLWDFLLYRCASTMMNINACLKIYFSDFDIITCNVYISKHGITVQPVTSDKQFKVSKLDEKTAVIVHTN